jgi:hypothetical protein
MLDLVVDRRELKATIARALRFMRTESVPLINEVQQPAAAGAIEPSR